MRTLQKLLVIAPLLLAVELAACSGMTSMQNPPPNIQNPNFIFVANTNSNAISVFESDPKTGEISAVGGPFATGIAPEFMATDPKGKFLYVADNNSNDVTAFQINTMSGGLTPVPGSPFPAGSQPKGVAIISNANLTALFVVNESSNDISAFRVDSATGALSAIPGSPFAVAGNPIGVTANPAGTLLYVTSLGSNAVTGFQIDQTTGALAAVPGGGFGTGQTPIGLLADPNGNFLYVADHMQNAISGYSINPTSGALTQVSGPTTASIGCPGCHTGDTRPLRLVTHPNGNFAYASNVAAGTVSSFSVSNGMLTPIGSAVAAGQHPFGMTFDPSGNFLYVANKVDDTISGFQVSMSTGMLTPLANSPFAAGGSGPVDIVVIRSQ